ncbi:hypothetical protein KY329_03940 [Candidatus Woesearchaeota archaeon]|nr:hypothetical protein [Candidatus Woesearchaeota archaeon]
MVKNEISKCRLGLTFGVFFGALHAFWAALVGLGVGQQFLNWVYPLHFIMDGYTVMAFTWGKALGLTALAFVGAYVMGWLIAAVWNWTAKFH